MRKSWFYTFSTGEEHQKFVPLENVINGIVASYNLGISFIAINVEARYGKMETTVAVRTHPKLAKIIEEGRLLIVDGSWLGFKVSESRDDVPRLKQQRPCQNIFGGLVVNPYSQLLACCGLTVEYNPFLKLGSLSEYSIKELYDKQFDDLFKVWLFVDGPEYIYEKVVKTRNVPFESSPHECGYCIKLVKDPENIMVIKNLLHKEADSMFYRAKMRQKSLRIDPDLSVSHSASFSNVT